MKRRKKAREMWLPLSSKQFLKHVQCIKYFGEMRNSFFINTYRENNKRAICIRPVQILL